MRPAKSVLKFTVLPLLFSFLFATSVFASYQFHNQAEKYLNKRCSRARVPGIYAVLCDFRSRLNTLEATIASLQSKDTELQEQIDGMSTEGKEFRVFDANGQYLGISQTGPGGNTFIEDKNKYIHVYDHGDIAQVYIPIYFTDTNCESTPYYSWNGHHRYFIYKTHIGFVVVGDTLITDIVRSQTASISGFECEEIEPYESTNLMELVNVPYPFEHEVVGPLEIRYE